MADVDALVAAAAAGGDDVAVAVTDGVIGVATAAGSAAVEGSDPAALVARAEAGRGPRWVWWDQVTPAALTGAGVRVARAWDVAAVHRLLAGGWKADPARVWAGLHDRPTASIPALGQLGLLDDHGDEGDDPENPARPDGHLRPEWSAGGWSRTPSRVARWAATALVAARLQRAGLARLTGHPALATARSESAAELLAVELAADGLPVDVATAEAIIADAIGPRPSHASEEEAGRRRRDAIVLAHAPLGGDRDLRNPAHVRSLLRRVGVEVDDTRAWRLEPLREVHPFVDALLDVAQGRAHRDDLRLPVARHPRRCRRATAGTVDRCRRRRRPDDGRRRPPQHAGRAPSSGAGRAGSVSGAGRSRPDRTAGARGGLR